MMIKEIEEKEEICNAFNVFFIFFVGVGAAFAQKFNSSTSDINVPTTPASFNFSHVTKK